MTQKIVKTKLDPATGLVAVTTERRIKAWMQVIVSLITLIASILIVAAPNFAFPQKPDTGIQKLASGWIGLVIGYWLS